MAPKTKLSDDEKIIREAKERFERCESWEAETRRRFVEDLKFANADPDNNWQWDNTILNGRRTQSKPCLTINKTRQHNLQITNDAKQNKPGVNIRPVGDDASYDAAQVFEGIVRHIEYQSNAEQAYDTATMFQVQGGVGYWRVITDYVSDQSFDQEIYICRMKNPEAAYLDPDVSEADGSDARFGFIFEDIPTELFKSQYPEYEDMVSNPPMNNTDGWLDKDHVRIAEYYRKEQKADKLISFIVPPPFAAAGQQIILRKSKMDADIRGVYEGIKEASAQNPNIPAPQERDIITDEITWYKLAGNKIIDTRPWLGKYIPIVRIVGEETVIDGKLDRKGHTRSMKDAQRMYNYWTSEATTQVALQAKSPWIAPAEAIEGNESFWGAANIDNVAVLPYNSIGEGGNTIPAPQKMQPPQMASAYIQGMQICQDQLMMTSGQYQSQFGQNENATSGKAINERQRQGDNATYHFIDNLAVGIRFTGKILVDLIPKIYDTERVIRILAKDGTESQIQIKPDAPDAYKQAPEQQDPNQQKAQKTQQSVAAIFNPNVGRYEVESDIGPGYATRRQEAFNAMTQIAAQNPEFMKVGGDLLWKSADFPLSDELAERWSRIIPPNIKGDAPPPEVQQMQGQMKQLQDAVAQLHQQLTDSENDLEVKRYDAETKRLTALGNSNPQISVEQIQPLVMQIIGQMLRDGFGQEGQQQAPHGNPAPQQPPMPDASRQPDMGQQAPMPPQMQPQQGMM